MLAIRDRLNYLFEKALGQDALYSPVYEANESVPCLPAAGWMAIAHPEIVNNPERLKAVTEYFAKAGTSSQWMRAFPVDKEKDQYRLQLVEHFHLHGVLNNLRNSRDVIEFKRTDGEYMTRAEAVDFIKEAGEKVLATDGHLPAAEQPFAAKQVFEAQPPPAGKIFPGL